MNVVYFPTASDFRSWLEKNHAAVTELQVGFFRKAVGKPGMTYTEAVDEALCFGWIDGTVRKVDAERFTHRFTPRKPRSIWSNVNVAHVERLTAAGRMHPAGLQAFAARSPARTGIYSFEAGQAKELAAALATKFHAHAAAWKFFLAQPPGYRRQMTSWVASARQPATQLRRLERLIEHSAAARRVR